MLDDKKNHSQEDFAFVTNTFNANSINKQLNRDLETEETHAVKTCETRSFQVCVCVIHSVMSDSSAIPWTVAHQVSLSMEFSRQEYWGG